MNEITRLEFELVYFEAIVQHFSHYVTGTSPHVLIETVQLTCQLQKEKEKKRNKSEFHEYSQTKWLVAYPTTTQK